MTHASSSRRSLVIWRRARVPGTLRRGTMPRLRSPRGTACGRAGAALLLAASILCLAAPAASASSPLVVAPAEIAASTSVSVRVHGVASAGGLRVVLADASVSSSPVTVASAVAAAANGDAQTLVLDVPASVDATKDDYEFRLFRASAADASTPLARHDVRVFASLASLSGATRGDDGQDTRSKRALILETDKPQYKPGQTVRARALAIDALSLRPVAGAATFTFRDPNGFVAMRVTAEADAFGVASASLPTSAEPTLGDWAVEASFAETGNDATSIDARAALFVLEKYVLPTFEVAVAVESPSVFRGLDTVRGKVSATYTHGARVAGTADVAVWQKSFGGGGGGGEMPMFADMMMIEDEPLPNAEERGGSSGSDTYRLLKRFPSMALDGSAEDGETPFELDLSDASPAVDYGWGGWGGGAPALLVEATARDASTGETQTGTASVTPRYRALEVSISGPSLFKPGIDAELILRAESRDGAPAVGAFAATTTFFKSDGGSSAPIASAIELTERDAGVKRFYVRVPLNDAACCRVTDLSSYRSGSCCLNGAGVELDRDAPSLRAVVNGVAAGAGDVPDFAPYASWYGQMAPPVGVLDAFVSIHGVPLDRVAVGTAVTATVESSFDPPGGAFDWAAVAPGHGVTHSGSVARGGTLSFAATEAMRRDATLVAYVAHDGSGGEAANVVACAKKIGVTFAADAAVGFGLPETLALTLDASEVAPGDAVRLTATSSAPGSRVFVLAHDVSVLIQSGGRQSAMSASKILEAASAAGGAGADAGTPFDSTTMAASSCWPPADVDASELVLLTAMKVSSCDPADQMIMFDDAAMAGAGVPEIAFRGDAAAEESSAADDGVSQSSDADVGGITAVQTRRFFPETWVWESLDVDPSTGVGALDDLRAPDTITSWRFRAFATHPERGVAAAAAEADAATLVVAKPFFVRPNLPYSARRGESLAVKVGVYNALSQDVTATIQMRTVSLDCDAAESTPVGSPITVLVRAESFASATFAAFTPTSLGEVPVTFLATTDRVGVADAVQKTILVVPEGFAVTKTVNAVARRVASESADADASSKYALNVSLPDASLIVPDSIEARVTVIGDTMGNSIAGLERLVRVPFGCGEQNMITLAPNVAAIKYLAAVGRLTSELKKRAADNVLTGYQRQLTYRHGDGSFSAFGEASSASPSGSLWLTAFVLRVFADAQRVPALGVASASFDDAVVAAAAAFVASNQNADGSFADPAPVLHAEMAGGAGAGLGLAAYCLLAMVEGGRSGANVDASVAYVARESSTFKTRGPTGGNDAKDAFVVAVAARALTRACVFASKGCAEATAARAGMMAFGVLGDDGSTMRWGEDDADTDGIGAPHPIAVEATAYACSALVEGGDLAAAHLAARWLMLRRNDLGGFRSTQDTVVGLEALAAYAAATFDDDASLSVSVTRNARSEAPESLVGAAATACSAAPAGGYASSPVLISRENFDVMRVLDFGASSGVDVAVTGSGTAVVTLSVTYNLKQPVTGAYGAAVEARAVVGDAAAKKRRLFLRRSFLGSRSRSDSESESDDSAASAASAPPAFLDASDADAIEMTACVTRPGSYDGTHRDVAGMLVARVGVFTGFAPTEASLEKVRADGGAFARRVDWSESSNEVVLYLEGTAFDASRPLCVTFEVAKRTQVEGMQRATHVVAHYYRPDVASEATTAAAALRTIPRSETRLAAEISSVTVGGVAATEFDVAVSGALIGGAFDSFAVFGSACVGAAAVLLF